MGDMGGFKPRRAWLLGLFSSLTSFDENPKFGIPQALAKLHGTGGTDAAALEYISRVMEFRSEWDVDGDYGEIFTYPGLAQFLGLFGHKMSSVQRERVRSGLVTRAKDLLGHGTENHAAMRIASGYLFAQYFPDETWTDHEGVSRSSQEIMAAAKARLMQRGRNFFRAGNSEGLSTTYAFVNVYPLLNLIDFADDSEVRAAAEALALYHTAHIALNDFDGHILSPVQRQNAPQARFGPPHQIRDRYTPVTQQMLWLLFGQNQFIAEDFIAAAEAPFAVFMALSQWTPPPAILRIAHGEGTPYSIRSSLAFFGYWGDGAPNEFMRMVYRDRQYAIGAGNVRFDPDGFYLDSNLFNIVWSSPHRFNYLEVMHPYWRSNLGEDFWEKGATSPFQQAALHKNTAIVLFDIPDKDPFAGRGHQKQWALERDRQTDHLIRLGQCRFPKSVDEFKVDDDWYFAREGEVYLGIRVLRPGHTLHGNIEGGDLLDFHVIKSRHAKTGFVFEVGLKDTSGSFENFQNQLKANALHVNWETLEVTYTNSHSERLYLQYNTLLSEGANRLIPLVPDMRVNDVPLDFTDWPVIESVPVTLRDNVLQITSMGENLSVDWRGDIAIIRK